MNQFLKQLLAALMFLAILAGSACAADESGSITIENTSAGQTYLIYQVFDQTVSGVKNETSYSNNCYTLRDSFRDFFFADGNINNSAAAFLKEGSEGPALLNENSKTYSLTVTDDNVSDFSQKLLSYIGEKGISPVKTVAADSDTTTVTGLSYGYFVLYPQGAVTLKKGSGSICSLTSSVPDQTVSIKSELPFIQKSILKIESKDGTFRENPEDLTVHIGDTVTYQITGTVPDTTGFNNAYIYQIQDRLTGGLTFSNNVVCTIGGKPVTLNVIDLYGENPKTEVDAGENALVYETDGFTCTFNFANQTVYQPGQTISITYTAVANQNAVVQSMDNTAALYYSNSVANQSADVPAAPINMLARDLYPECVTETKTELVHLDTFNIDINKVDQNQTALSGAQFVLKNANGKYYRQDENGQVSWTENQDDATIMTSSDTGTLRFTGIALGTYTLEEIKAPDGYSKAEAVKIDIQKNVNETTNEVTYSVDGTQLVNKAADDVVEASFTYTLTVENRTGSILPNTGGIGAIPVYVLAALCLAGAGLLIASKKRSLNK